MKRHFFNEIFAQAWKEYVAKLRSDFEKHGTNSITRAFEYTGFYPLVEMSEGWKNAIDRFEKCLHGSATSEEGESTISPWDLVDDVERMARMQDHYDKMAREVLKEHFNSAIKVCLHTYTHSPYTHSPSLATLRSWRSRSPRTLISVIRPKKVVICWQQV